jgi:AraC-type DNA-binding domain-containing proteins
MESSIGYLRFVKEFSRDKLSLAISVVSLCFLLMSFFLFFKKEPLYFFPNPANNDVTFYNDKVDGGKSIITDNLKTDSCLFMKFVLKDGFVRPYVGVSIQDKFPKETDISMYNRVKIEASGEGTKSVFVYLVLKDSILKYEGSPLGIMQLNQYIHVTSQRSTFILRMSDFRAPDWWFDKYNIPPTSMAKPDFKRLQGISIATGLTPQLNQLQSFKIYSITFYNDYVAVFCSMLIIQLSVVLILLVIFYYRNRPQKEVKPLTVNYIPVTVPITSEPDKGFMDYINNNFQDADLNLDVISKQTGYSKRIISEHISSQFQCNVKTYINQIRINEALRLLKETDLNISEIAYKVGFSSPSNFNRVFKNLTGKTPSIFLQEKE